MASPAFRSTFRSSATSFWSSAPRVCHSIQTKTHRCLLQLPKQKPLSQRIFFRSPVELSCAVDLLMPFRTATSSALLTSMLSASSCACRLPEGCGDDS